MRAVRRSDTAPEIAVRRLLHSAGYRYRLHDGQLSGRPDIVFRGRRKVIFVHGCFWHGHECRKGRLPKSRVDYWRAKITRNHRRDERAVAELEAGGWRCLIIWECEVRDVDKIANRLTAFLEDHAGIDGRALAADQTFDHTALDSRCEQPPQEIAVAQAPVAVFEKVEWSGTAP